MHCTPYMVIGEFVAETKEFIQSSRCLRIYHDINYAHPSLCSPSLPTNPSLFQIHPVYPRRPTLVLPLYYMLTSLGLRHDHSLISAQHSNDLRAQININEHSHLLLYPRPTWHHVTGAIRYMRSTVRKGLSLNGYTHVVVGASLVSSNMLLLLSWQLPLLQSSAAQVPQHYTHKRCTYPWVVLYPLEGRWRQD